MLPSDASPLLLRVLQSASPLRSLEQLSDETGLDMAVLDRVVQHLQRWGKIRLIHPLTQESIFGVCPDAPLHASVDFERTFDIVETGYATLIALFCAGQPFGAVLRAAEELGVPKRRFVQMTLYLLQTHTLFQLHTYVHCVCEPPPPTADDSDRAAPAEVARARWRLFRRLQPMFHGEHHLEEIMWQERLSREVLNDLLRAYDDYIITVVARLDYDN